MVKSIFSIKKRSIRKEEKREFEQKAMQAMADIHYTSKRFNIKSPEEAEILLEEMLNKKNEASVEEEYYISLIKDLSDEFSLIDKLKNSEQWCKNEEELKKLQDEVSKVTGASNYTDAEMVSRMLDNIRDTGNLYNERKRKYNNEYLELYMLIQNYDIVNKYKGLSKGGEIRNGR